jgi:hypothetical protein
VPGRPVVRLPREFALVGENSHLMTGLAAVELGLDAQAERLIFMASRAGALRTPAFSRE